MKRIKITRVNPGDDTYTGTPVLEQEIYDYFNLEAEVNNSNALKWLDVGIYKIAMRAYLHDLWYSYGIYAYEIFVVLIGILTYNTLSPVTFMLITLAAQYAIFIKGVRRVISIWMFIPVILYGKEVRKVGYEILDGACSKLFFKISFVLQDKARHGSLSDQYKYIVQYDDFKSYMQERLAPQYRDLQSNMAHLKILRYVLSDDIYDNSLDFEYDFKRF